MAAHFRRPDVGRFLRELTPRELLTWMLYEELEPFGERRADYNAAQIVAMVHNVAVKEENQKDVEKFLLKFEKKVKQKKYTAEQQVALAYSIVEAHNRSIRAGAKDM